MSRSSAQTAVVIAMFWVAVVYGYRKLTEPITAGNAVKAVPQTAHFIIGWLFLAVVLSVMAQAAPALGGSFAILVGVGDTMVNGKQIFSDVTGALKATSTAEGG